MELSLVYCRSVRGSWTWSGRARYSGTVRSCKCSPPWSRCRCAWFTTSTVNAGCPPSSLSSSSTARHSWSAATKLFHSSIFRIELVWASLLLFHRHLSILHYRLLHCYWLAGMHYRHTIIVHLPPGHFPSDTTVADICRLVTFRV